MKTLAFDQSSAKTGYCVGDPNAGRPYFGSFRTPKRDDVGERLAMLFKNVGELIAKFEPDLIAMEQPFFPVGDGYSGGDSVPLKFSNRTQTGTAVNRKGAAFNVKTISLLQKVAGVIELQAALHGVPVESYSSRSWPPTILGGPVPKGADVKKLVKERVQMMGYDVAGDDESDAIGIWYHSTHGKPASARAQTSLLELATAAL